jgi:mRNA-degrading endonuclease YafQ of YafQ-DinJ toxin-antitoxin module
MIVFHRKFLKQQSKFSPSIQFHIQERIGLFIDTPSNPLLNTHALHHPYENCFSINISGNIRAVYELQENGDILFIRVGTHSELYK